MRVRRNQLAHLRGARAAAHYATDFYAGRPAVTVNELDEGRAWYLASRNEDAFLDAFYATVVDEAGVSRVYPDALAPGVTKTLLFARAFGPGARLSAAL